MKKTARHEHDGKRPDTRQPLDAQGSAPDGKPIPAGVASLCKAVRSARGAKKYLSRLLQAYQRGEINSENAKTSVYVLSEFLRAWDVSTYQDRLEAIEKKLNIDK